MGKEGLVGLSSRGYLVGMDIVLCLVLTYLLEQSSFHGARAPGNHPCKRACWERKGTVLLLLQFGSFSLLFFHFSAFFSIPHGL